MKSIKTLLRVKQREIDALKRQQGVLELQREEVHGIIDRLGQQLVHEMKAAQNMPEMAHFFGDFSTTIKQRQEQMHTHLRTVEKELDKITAQIRERFNELKKYEIALENWKKRSAEKLRASDQREMDEIAIRGYVRRDVV